jgi:hypothetical protein
MKLEELHQPVQLTYTFWNRVWAAMSDRRLRYSPFCRDCKQDWPCSTILLVHPELADAE